MTLHSQGSPEWIQERLGLPTASRFKDILPLPRSKAAREAGVMAKVPESYMYELLAERITGEPQGQVDTKATTWGHDNEPNAVAVFEALTGLRCDQVGFVERWGVGCSPDRLIGDHSGLEVKCPYCTRVHLQYVLGGVLPREHTAQVQGAMWLTDAISWHFVSFDPRIPDTKLALFHVAVARDDAYIENLEKRVLSFRDEMLNKLETLLGGEK